MLERERKIAIRLLITGSGVRIPHNPHHLPSRRALDNYTLILTVNTPSIHFFPTDNNV
jgi:hypothetical protein